MVRTTVHVCVSEMFLTRFRRGLSGKHIYMIVFLRPQAVWAAQKQPYRPMATSTAIPHVSSAIATLHTHACIKWLGCRIHQWLTSTGTYASTGALSHIVQRALWISVKLRAGSIRQHKAKAVKSYITVKRTIDSRSLPSQSANQAIYKHRQIT